MKDNIIKFIAFILFIVFVVLAYATLTQHEDYAQISFMDVGQGDAAFIITPEGRQILVDGGPDATVLSRLGEYIPPWDRSIDVVIATHPEADHIAGLVDVLKNYEVSYIIESGLRKETGLSLVWEEAVENENAEIILADSPKRIVFGNKTFIDILWPADNYNMKIGSEVNNFSVVVKFTHGENAFLFTADVERWAEQKILAQGINLDADVLKIPHHGSKTSSSEILLEAVKPKAAVISAGRNNKYGHPNGAVLERLDKFNIPVLRTDISGDIIFKSDGRNILIGK